MEMNNKKIWRKLHRWVGLILVGFVVFYCVTGLLLNHRRDFDYFQQRQKSVVRVKIQDPRILHDFIDTYKQQINRSDDPRVIRIREDGTIEFLYGSHGRTTYVIEPQAGTMTRIDKSERQPWHWLNRLHKTFKTSGSWLLLTDLVGLLVIFLTLTGLVIFRYTRHDFLLLIGGLVLLLLGMVVA
jgi:hypothetical protein